MSGFMVRLQDGSEIGPLDPAMIRSWYEQGLIDRDSLVMRPGSRRWTKLSEAVDVRHWVGSGIPETRGRSRAVSRRARVREPKEPLSYETPTGQRRSNWRMLFAASILIAAALLAGYWYWFPTRQIPALNEVPWLQVALAFLALALSLFPSWELGRKAARLLLFVAFVALFPLAGILLAKKSSYEAILVLAGAATMSIGLVGLLMRGAASLWKSIVFAIIAVCGLVGVIRFGFVVEGAEEKSLREWITTTREYSEPTLGLKVAPPRGWVILRADQTVVETPLEAHVVLARQDGSGFAYLVSEKVRSSYTLDEYLSRVFTLRRMKRPAITEQERTSVDVGGIPGRRVIAIWSEGDKSYYDVTVVWRDGATHFILAAWVVGVRPREALQSLDALIQGVSCGGQSALIVRQAVARVTEEVPFLSSETAEMLMSMSDAGVLEPDEIFRRSQKLAASGILRLPPDEVREFRTLSDGMYTFVSRRERARIAAYLEKLRRGEFPSADEDRQVRALVKQATLRLSGEKRSRLQVLFQKAILASVRPAG